jgi:vacuolar-type H+-ATPase subunit H
VNELKNSWPDGGALASIRRLEQTLTEGANTRTTAESLLLAARTEAEQILAAAAKATVEASAERRRQTRAAADRDAAATSAEGEAHATALRETASAVMGAAVDAAVALIVTATSESAA